MRDFRFTTGAIAEKTLKEKQELQKNLIPEVAELNLSTSLMNDAQCANV